MPLVLPAILHPKSQFVKAGTDPVVRDKPVQGPLWGNRVGLAMFAQRPLLTAVRESIGAPDENRFKSSAGHNCGARLSSVVGGAATRPA